MAFLTIEKWLGKKDLIKAEKVGERLGGLAYRLVKSRRNRALSNLKLAFPEMSEEERIQIAKGVFEHFGRIMCDFVRSGKRSTDEVLQSITFEGLEHFDAALAGGRGRSRQPRRAQAERCAAASDPGADLRTAGAGRVD